MQRDAKGLSSSRSAPTSPPVPESSTLSSRSSLRSSRVSNGATEKCSMLRLARGGLEMVAKVRPSNASRNCFSDLPFSSIRPKWTLATFTSQPLLVLRVLHYLSDEHVQIRSERIGGSVAASSHSARRLKYPVHSSSLSQRTRPERRVLDQHCLPPPTRLHNGLFLVPGQVGFIVRNEPQTADMQQRAAIAPSPESETRHSPPA